MHPKKTKLYTLLTALVLPLIAAGAHAQKLSIQEVPLTPNHILYDSINGKVYASIPGTAALNPNTVAQINTATGAVEAYIPVAGGLDANTQLLWNNLDGRMTVSYAGPYNLPSLLTQAIFGPYPGWTANAISIGSDDITHILWTNTNGTMSLWNYNTSSSTFTFQDYGPYPGWTAKAITDGSDGKTVVLWDNTDGHASLWSLNNTTGQFTQYTFGPYPGWTATAVSGGN